MRVRVLGAVEARAGAQEPWQALPPQQRVVLALLSARRGEPCPIGLLEQALWADDPPARPQRLLQALVSRLRRRLSDDGAACLVTRPDGWQLDLDPAQVDAARFERLVDDAQRCVDAGDDHTGRVHLIEALELWRGAPFGDLADHPLLVGEATRLNEQHLAAQEHLLELRLRAGEARAVVHEVAGLIEAQPLRERLHELHLRALYQAGQPAEALTAYQQLRGLLADELGVEPGPRLQALHTAMLRHDLPPEPSSSPGPVMPRPPAARVVWPCRRDLPMTGRDHELDHLEGILARARDGQREICLVVGEPGVGKTRLVAELADRAASMQVLVGRCSDGAGIPYQPFVEALRIDLARPGGADLARLDHYVGPLARLVPELVDHPGPPPSTNPRLERHHLFTAIDAWLRAAASERPVLLVLEDLQWATGESLLLLRHLARTDPSIALAIVATSRDEEGEHGPALVEALAELVAHPAVSELRLGPLPPQDIGHLVAAHAAGARVPSRLAGELYEATGGNPLFVQELLAGTPEEVDALPRAADGSLRLPQTLRWLLDARRQRLSEAAVRLLEQAAIVGELVDFAVVADATDLHPSDALDGLDEAIEARVLVPERGTPDRYRFAHAVMRQALRDRVSPSRRARLHARYAAALERAHPDPTPVTTELAYHLAEAGPAVDLTRTRAALQAAGDAAVAQSAHGEAADHYRRALDLGPADDRERCDLLIALGDAQQHAGPGDHSATLLDALRLATDLGDVDRIVAAAWAHNRGYPSHLYTVDEAQVAALERALDVVGSETIGARATLLALLGGELTFADGGRTDRARHLSDQALELARHADATVLARVLMLRQFTITGPDTVQERLSNTAELVPLADELADPSLQVFAREWRAVAAMEAADRPEVDVRVDEVLARAEELGEPFMLGTAHMLATSREIAWGDLAAVPERAIHAERLGLEADAIDIRGVTTFQLLWCHRERGDVTPVLPRLEELSVRYGGLPHWEALEALASWEQGDHEVALAILDRFAEEPFAMTRAVAGLHALCCLAEVAADGRHAPAASQLLAALEPYAAQLDASQAMCTGPVAYFLGRPATTLGRWQHAEDWLTAAGDISARVGADRWSRRVQLARAQLLTARGDPGDAEEAARLLEATATSAEQAGHLAVSAACLQT